MKKCIVLLVTAVLFSLAACAQAPEPAAPEAEVQIIEHAAEPVETAEVHEKAPETVKPPQEPETVDLTFPAAFYEGQSKEEIQSAAAEADYLACTVNDDGSVTCTMTETVRQELLKSYRIGVDKILTNFTKGADAVASFRSIAYSDDMTRFDIRVDAAEYAAWDTLYAPAFYAAGAYFQIFSGVPADEIEIAVSFIDDTTGSLLVSTSYQEHLASLAAAEADSLAITAKERVREAEIFEFFVDNSRITAEVVPPQSVAQGTHYEANSGCVYIDICVAYKNLSAKDRQVDATLTAALACVGAEEYVGTVVVESENRSSFADSGAVVAPHCTEYIHLLFEVPAKVETDSEPIVVSFTIESNQYCYTVRS